MKKSNRARLLLLALSLLAAVGPHSDASELSKEISPLLKPTLTGARDAVRNLGRYAATQSGNEKVRTQRLAGGIKNLFTAEFKFNQAVEAAEKAETEAVRLERNAEDWMTPNGFGKVNRVAAREALVKAKELREGAVTELGLSTTHLHDNLREYDVVMRDFYELGEVEIVIILADAAQAVIARRLPDQGYESAFPKQAVAKLREFMQMREDWLLTAKRAEAAENYEEALRYYTKARDYGGRKRVAARLAIMLETAALPGSAIDYYEIAGDYKKAAQLRAKNPELGAEAFRRFDAEDLYAKVAPCCVRVNQGKSGGSGFFFARGGYVLTNQHVVDGQGAIKARLADGRTFDAKVIAKSNKPDLAIIRVPLEEHDKISMADQELLKIGTPVALIGFPIDDFPTATMNSGRISNTERTFAGNPVYQLDLSANHGNSGGPVVDESGRLIGILTFGLGDLDIDRFNFAIRVEAVRAFVKEHLPDKYAF